MATIEKIRDDLYIRKGWDGYRVVYPNKKELDKPFSFQNANWKNILYGGHWSYILKMAIFLLLLYLFVQMYLSDTRTCRDFINNIDENCQAYFSTLSQSNSQDYFNSTLPEDFPNLTFIKENATPKEAS